jgi:hypothetical protein
VSFRAVVLSGALSHRTGKWDAQAAATTHSLRRRKTPSPAWEFSLRALHRRFRYCPGTRSLYS